MSKIAQTHSFPKLTKQQAISYLARFKKARGSISMLDFAIHHELNFYSLRNWSGRLTRNNRSLYHVTTPSDPKKLVHFVPVKIPNIENVNDTTAERIDITLPNGITIQVGPQFNQEALCRLLALLETRSC